MKCLTLDEMHYLLRDIKHPMAAEFKNMLQSVGTLMAAEIGRVLNVGHNAAISEEPEFGGTCAQFFADRGQACPPRLTKYDATEWTDSSGAEIVEIDNNGDEIPPRSACQNCDWTGPEEALDPIKDIHQRVAPGEPMPSGECPKCGALCHEIEET